MRHSCVDKKKLLIIQEEDQDATSEIAQKQEELRALRGKSSPSEWLNRSQPPQMYDEV